MTNDKRLTDQQINSLIARKSIKPKTYGKTKPRQERIVDIRNMTDKSSILNRNLDPKTFQNQTFGVPRLQK